MGFGWVGFPPTKEIILCGFFAGGKILSDLWFFFVVLGGGGEEGIFLQRREEGKEVGVGLISYYFSLP